MLDLHESPEAEAKQLLTVQSAGGLKGATAVLMQQFNVLQTRAQMMLTITTLTLTITGFPAPRLPPPACSRKAPWWQESFPPWHPLCLFSVAVFAFAG
uniref:hypothetical protein n=1 Tax=Cephaloticoccus sp. TaxID=1985742 RepID=UPI004049DB9F